MANGIDFNPQPSYGADPFAPLAQGVQTGLNLGLGVQQFQQRQLEMEQQRREQAQQAFQTGLEMLSKPLFKALPNSQKQELALKTAQAGKDAFGIDISLEGIDFGNPAFSRVAKDLSVIMGDNSLTPQQKRDAGQAKIAEAAGEFMAPGEDIERLQSFLPSAYRSALAGASGGKGGAGGVPTVAEQKAQILMKFRVKGYNALTPQEQQIFDRDFARDSDFVRALQVVGGNFNNIGANSTEILQQALVLSQYIKADRERRLGLNQPGQPAQPGMPTRPGSTIPLSPGAQQPGGSPILNVRPKQNPRG
jgi:hypothetical protein